MPAHDVGRRALAGMRWALALTLVTLPLSFLTNMLLARISPLALGQYGAIMLFSSAFQTIAVPGGPKLFTRFVPLLDRDERVSFLLTYTLAALGAFLLGFAVTRVVAPGALAWVLARFGLPSLGLALAVSVALLASTFLTTFLFAVLRGRGASWIIRFPVIGFFVAAVLGVAHFRTGTTSDVGPFLWICMLVIVGICALMALVLTLRTDEMRHAARVRLLLPRGFWPALTYTHLESVAGFAYSSLAPTFVLFWLDLAALAPFHAALRYPALFDGIAGLFAALLSPALAALDAAGERERAFRHARRTVDAVAILSVPVSLVLIFFASDAMGIFGAQYRASADLLRFVAIAVAASSVVQFGGGMLVAFGEYPAYLAMSCISIAAALGLNLVLLPALGVSGAAWAASLAALTHACVVTVILRVRLGFRVSPRVLYAALVPIAAVAVAILLAPGRIGSALCFVGFALVFAVVARVSVPELVAELKALRPGRFS